MKILGEFREFISRGNVIDLAVGVIIGAAFGKIVSTLVDGVIMPVVGLLTTGVDFTQLKVVLKPANAVLKQTEVAIKYGDFINAIVQFVIVGATVFFLVKTVNMLRRLTARQEEALAAGTPPAPTPTDALLMEIRDALRAQSPNAARGRKAPQSPKAPAQKRPTSRKSS